MKKEFKPKIDQPRSVYTGNDCLHLFTVFLVGGVLVSFLGFIIKTL